MPKLQSAAVGLIAIKNEMVPLEAAGGVGRTDASLTETLARLASGATPTLGQTDRVRKSRFGLRRGDELHLAGRLMPPHESAPVQAPSATVYVEADLPRLVDQLKAEAESLGERIAAALDVAKRATALDAAPQRKLH